jgi:predicted MFS family arabinose efflux permease
MAVGPALGGILAHVHFSWIFLVDGATSLIAASVLTWGPSMHGAERTPPPAAAISRTAWRDARLFYLLLSSLPILLVFFQAEGALAVWVVHDLGRDTRLYGALFTLNTILIVVFEVWLNLATSKWPRSRQLVVGAMLVTLGFSCTALARNDWLLLGTVVLWTFGEMILIPSLSDAAASLASPDRRGEYMGLYGMTMSAGISLGPWLGVTVLARFGPVATWAGCGALGAVSVLLLGGFDSVVATHAQTCRRSGSHSSALESERRPSHDSGRSGTRARDT